MVQLPNLLIVDDIEENLLFLEAIIRKVNVNLIRALSGAEALEKTRGMDIALALIDVRMPGMNGYELAVRLNEDRIGDKVPVIFITAGQINDQDTFKGYDSGAVDYFFKPINSFVLLSKINVFLDLFNQKLTIRRDAELLRRSAEVLSRVNTVIRTAEEKYRSYINNAPDGVFITDENGRFLEVNEAACRLTGFSKDQLSLMSVEDILPEESIDKLRTHAVRLAKDGTSNIDLLFEHQNGSRRWFTMDAVKLDETRFLVFSKDITDRKKAEEELKSSLEQLHHLTEYIQSVREEERVAISRELHDDLGQALTAVKIDLGIIKQKVADPDAIFRIIKVTSLVNDTIKTVQKLTAQLRPQILDDLGLEAAIEWYTSEFAQRTGMEVILDLESGLAISPESSLAIFRILQESFTNTARHSGATRVEVGLRKAGDRVVVIITDNGKGMKGIDLNSKKSYGLISMRERALSLGGTFEIRSGNEKGTSVNLILPV